MQGNSSSGDAIITQLQWGPVQIYNTTLTCRATTSVGSDVAPPPVTLVAETAAQLLLGIQLLGQLQPSTITLARDMSVPADTWPKGLMVNRSLVLAGLPPPAPRTLLDMYQVGHGRAGHNIKRWIPPIHQHQRTKAGPPWLPPWLPPTGKHIVFALVNRCAITAIPIMWKTKEMLFFNTLNYIHKVRDFLRFLNFDYQDDI